MRPHWPGDVLDLLLAHVLKREIELVPHLLVRRRADADPARLGQRFEPGGNIDAVAEDVAILDDDVTDIDAHAKFDPPSRRHGGIADDHFALHLDGTAHGIKDAGEFDEEAVAGRLDDATAVLGDLAIAKLSADRARCGERALLIFAHQSRIAGDIDSEYRCQPALDPLFAHPAGPLQGAQPKSMMEIGWRRAASALRVSHPSVAIACSVSLSSSALASLRSAVSKPSVNQR